MVVRPLSRATSRTSTFKDAPSRSVQTTPRLKLPRAADFGYALPLAEVLKPFSPRTSSQH
eukprot:2101838-Pyramimonas_sp.AAC.1